MLINDIMHHNNLLDIASVAKYFGYNYLSGIISKLTEYIDTPLGDYIAENQS